MNINGINIPDQYIRLDKLGERFVEIVCRRKNGRIASMMKVFIDSDAVSKSEDTINLLSKKNMDIPWNKVRKQIAGLKGDLNQVLNGIDGLNINMEKAMHNIDGIAKNMNVMMGLQWLNLGASLVNVGVSVVGFMIMAEKLNNISAQMDKLSKEIADIKVLSEEQTILKDHDNNISNTKILIANINAGKEVSHREMQELLKAFGNYLRSLLRIAENAPSDTVMNILFEMLPIFSNLIVLYYEIFYDEYGKAHDPLHDEWIGVFNKAGSIEFREHLKDYYIMEQHRHLREAEDIAAAEFLMVANMHIRVEDTVALLDAAGNIENYKKIMAAVDDYIFENEEGLAKEFDGVLPSENIKNVVKELHSLA